MKTLVETEGTTMEPGRREAQGWAARQFAAEDARWVADTVRSSHGLSGWQPYIGLLLSHHFVRVAYEGALLLRSQNPYVGIPQFADQLTNEFAAITARARHTSKVLDDTEKSYEEIISEFGDALTRSRSAFLSRTAWVVRWMASDLGLYVMDGRLLGASIPTAYRLDVDPQDTSLMSNERITDVSAEWGGTMAFLGSADMQPPVEEGSIVLPPCNIAGVNRVSRRYLSKRYDNDFSEQEKLLVLMIEGDLNTSLWLLSLLSAGHEMSVFRMRVTTLYHSLTSLNRLLERHASAGSKGAEEMKDLLRSEAVNRILSKGGKSVRNRCVHYEIRSKTFVPSRDLPMLGIVEEVFPGQTWAGFNADVLAVTDSMVRLLKDWRPLS